MKEQEMRQMVRDLLGQTVRRVVMPASLGIGLALAGGCDHRAVPVQTDGAVQEIDQGNARYATPFPAPDLATRRDLSRDKPAPKLDSGEPVSPSYGVPFPEPDAGMAGRYGVPFPGTDGG